MSTPGLIAGYEPMTLKKTISRLLTREDFKRTRGFVTTSRALLENHSVNGKRLI